MTRKIALTLAMAAVDENATYTNPNYHGEDNITPNFTGHEVREQLEKMIKQLNREITPAQREVQNAKRREKNAEKRKNDDAVIYPLIIKALTENPYGLTTKQITDKIKEEARAAGVTVTAGVINYKLNDTTWRHTNYKNLEVNQNVSPFLYRWKVTQ